MAQELGLGAVDVAERLRDVLVDAEGDLALVRDQGCQLLEDAAQLGDGRLHLGERARPGGQVGVRAAGLLLLEQHLLLLVVVVGGRPGGRGQEGVAVVWVCVRVCVEREREGGACV